MSEQSDKLITEVARLEWQQLKDSVVRTACCWRVSPVALRAALLVDLCNAIDCLRSFEEEHKERLNMAKTPSPNDNS